MNINSNRKINDSLLHYKEECCCFPENINAYFLIIRYRYAAISIIMDKTQKNILVVTSTFPRWENDQDPPFIYELSKRLVSDKFQIFVLAPHTKNSKTYEEIDGMQVFRYRYLPSFAETLSYEGGILPKLRKNKFNYLQVPFFLLFQLMAIKRIIKKSKIDFIHAHWIIPQGLIAVLYKKLFNKNIKIICTIHGSDVSGLKNAFFNKLKKFTIKNIDQLTIVSHALKCEILKLGVNPKIEVVPMGIDTAKFSPDQYSEEVKRKYDIRGPFLLYVGRLTIEKGIRYLLKAMPSIIQDFPNARLLIIGSGTLEQELQDLCINLNLEKYVLFLGAKQNSALPPYYATADIFVGPSVSEGLPITYMEAMASCCALIGTDLEGNKDLILHQNTGILVRQRDSSEIYQKIKQLIDNKDLREKIQRSARNFIVEKFDWKVISQRYRDLFN